MKRAMQSNNRARAAQKSAEAVDVTVISIQMGVIQLIEPNGSIGWYRQTGLKNFTALDLQRFIREGKLAVNALDFNEVPANYRLSFEEPSIMGRAYKSFNPNRKTR